MTTATTTAPVPQIERDRWGRPMVIPPEGGKKVSYRRVTTFIDVLDDRHALELWKQRQVAYGMAMRQDLVLKAASASGDKKLLNEVVKSAEEAAGSTQAATTGTALHAITEQIDRVEDALIPPTSQPDIDAYRATTSDLTMAMIEVFVVNDVLKVGGTFDRIVQLPDGTLVVADIKTGSIDYGAGKIAMQLALYSRSRLYNISTGERTPLQVDTSRGLVIHLPAGSGQCELKWADLDIGWTGVQIAKDVWDWRGERGQLEAQPPNPVPDIHGLISMAADRTSLEGLFRQFADRWTDGHTQAAKARIAQLESSSPAPAA